MYRKVYAAPTIRGASRLRRKTPWMKTLRNPRLKRTVVRVAVLTYFSFSIG
jgi:hypothetical protein